MKINIDCVKEILKLVEKIEDPHKPFLYEMIDDSHIELKEYSYNEVSYHAKQCNLSELFDGYKVYSAGDILIKSLSPKGQEFLDGFSKKTVFKQYSKLIIDGATTLLPFLALLTGGQ